MFGDNKANSLEGNLNRTFKLIVKTKPDSFIKVFKACLKGRIFLAQRRCKNLCRFQKPDKPPAQSAFWTQWESHLRQAPTHRQKQQWLIGASV